MSFLFRSLALSFHAVDLGTSTRAFYRGEELFVVVHNYWCMDNPQESGMAAYYSTRQVAELLGVRWYRVKYSHQAGHVPEPLRIGNVRMYDEADIERLKKYFSIEGDLPPALGGPGGTREPNS